MERAARHVVRRRAHGESRPARTAGSPGVSDRRDRRRRTRLRRRRRRARRRGEGGEFSAILFKADRFRVADAGTFWFSDTPAVPGSKTWGNNITRISSWARFVDRDGRGFYHFNLHLDHESQPSREKSTQLLRERIAARAFPLEPAIVTGDFNVGEKNPALATLVSGTSAPFVDTFRQVHPHETVVGTFSGFKFGTINGEKIDYILVQPGTEVLSAAILRTSRNNRYPSDHFPVVARVRLVWPVISKAPKIAK